LFFTTNCFECQHTTSQYFQSLALQTSALAAAAIYFTLPESGTENMAKNMISTDEYQGIFASSPVIHFTVEAIALAVTH